MPFEKKARAYQDQLAQLFEQSPEGQALWNEGIEPGWVRLLLNFGINYLTLDRLYEKGWIENPRSKAKSVVLTETGLAKSADLFQHYFGLSSETQDGQ